MSRPQATPAASQAAGQPSAPPHPGINMFAPAHGPPGGGMMFPGGFAQTAGHHGMVAVDPYLPCHSRHFTARRASMAAAQASNPNAVSIDKLK